MAIPIYSPGSEDYRSRHNPTSTMPQTAGVNSSAVAVAVTSDNNSFLHQLALELYSVYHDYCLATANGTTATAAEDGVPALPEEVHDINNNFIRPRRPNRGEHSGQRQEAIDSGTSLPIPRTSQHAQAEIRLRPETGADPVNDLQAKQILPIDSWTAVGRQLREIADSYENPGENFAPHSPKSPTKSMNRRNTIAFHYNLSSTFWYGPICLVLMTTAAAAVVSSKFWR